MSDLVEQHGGPHTRTIHDGKVKVWDEIAITINLGGMQFLKFTHGQERLCRNNGRAIARAEREINDCIREVVEARVSEYRGLIDEIHDDKDR